MAVLLMRHGEAGESGPQWPDDRLRPLTHPGRKESRQAGELITLLGWRPAQAIASPYLRTQETAQEFLSACKRPPPLEAEAALQPGGRLQRVLERIRETPADSLLYVCGHQPEMGQLAEALAVAVDFKKGALALLQPRSSGRQMKLLLFLEPRAWR
jgi:phosphohistidine phosphatase